MQREIVRTIQSFLPPYQVGIEDQNVEIIVIDTGSQVLPDLTQFKDKVKLITFKTKHPSPVEAVNHGIKIASSNLVGVLIDGARMVTPGMCRDVIQVNAMYDRVFISTLAFHLGPDVQMSSVFEGYNQEVEDNLLDELDWHNNGYDLYLASELALSSINGLYGPIAESNAIFADKDLWHELGGYDERFISIGGGLSNLDLYKRAGELANTKLIRLTSEATFHQVHGGVATNNKVGIYNELFDREYQAIRGVPFSICDKIPELYGKMLPQVAYFFSQHSLFNDIESTVKYKSMGSAAMEHFPDFNNLQMRLNTILATMTDGLYFKSTQVKPKNTLSHLIDSPIIVIGRGGSGTRILSRLIQDMDLFLGNEFNESDDSQEWVEPIYNLVLNRHFISNDSFNNHNIKIIRLNALKILRKAKIVNNLWGFKLPETMLCLPELLKSFPKAKIIHLTRHPISLSLRRSHVTSRMEDQIGMYVLEQSYKKLKLDFNNVYKSQVWFNNAVSWNYQLDKVINYAEHHLTNNNYCEIKYEDLCSKPFDIKNKIIDFLGVDSKQNFNVNELIDSSRINTFNYQDKSDEINVVWKICEDIAKKIGYEKNNYHIKFLK